MTTAHTHAGLPGVGVDWTARGGGIVGSGDSLLRVTLFFAPP
ncbi:hypothetical protein [Nakamurella antarctica]|nr:hypothetical protein [Nakamurella antarctica]